jgi:hypothetical protein
LKFRKCCMFYGCMRTKAMCTLHQNVF